jgi:hypothetical protein
MISMEEVLLYFSLLHCGDWFKIFNSIKNKDKFDKQRFNELKLSLNLIMSQFYLQIIQIHFVN